jgi:hypothetical protein
MIRTAPGLALVLALVAAVLGYSGCSGKLPPLAPASTCGDQCASVNCPPGSYCTLDGRCTPHCQPETLPPK